MRRFREYFPRLLAVVLVGHAPLILADDDYRWISSEQSKVANWAVTQPSRTWTIDYRVRSMFESQTSYQFGTPEAEPGAYAPLSKLDWPLNSTWHGLQVGLERPNWNVRFEWLTPMTQNVSGEMADYDWSGANRAPASLSVSPERWNDGQMLDLGGEFKLTERFFALPIEIWPTTGFRFQRFDVTAYDGLQVINDGTMPDLPPVGYRWHEDTISFNQQYYMGYVGGQLRSKFDVGKLPIDLRFQGDWGAAWGYNVDHHISGYEADGVHRYTMERTNGGALHLAIIAEATLRRHLSVGLQADYLEIRTTGTHRFLMSGTKTANETWNNGVSAISDQKSLTAFVRAQF